MDNLDNLDTDWVWIVWTVAGDVDDDGGGDLMCIGLMCIEGREGEEEEEGMRDCVISSARSDSRRSSRSRVELDHVLHGVTDGTTLERSTIRAVSARKLRSSSLHAQLLDEGLGGRIQEAWPDDQRYYVVVDHK